MILSRNEIREGIEAGHIIIEPKPAYDQYSSSSLDLRLGEEFYRWDSDKINQPGLTVELRPSEADFFRVAASYTKEVPKLPGGAVHLEPNDFMLAITYERVELPLQSAIAARVEGRSSLARWGLQVHLTAPTIHAGWNGRIALELLNHGPFRFKLSPGDRLCQIIFERLGRSPDEQLETQFMGQESPAN